MFNWTADIKIAIHNLKSTRTRTILTVIGIIIGVASVTAILALGEGAKNAVSNESEVQDNLITIRAGKILEISGDTLLNYRPLALTSDTTFSDRDVNLISEVNGTAISPIMLVPGSVASGPDKAANATIIGTNVESQSIMDLQMATGEYLGSSSGKTVVLGHELAVSLLGSDTSIGQMVKLRGQPYTVSGILKKHQPSTGIGASIDLNYTAILPFEEARTLNDGTTATRLVVVRVKTDQEINTVAEQIHTKLSDEHNGEEDFTILKPNDVMQITDRIFNLITGFISAIASISVVVGGVGIMNIMLVSVTERTKEIGVRKAVGATNRQVLGQFLTEATLMSIIGGFFGIIFGYALAYIIGTIIGFMPGYAHHIPLIGFGVTVIIGLVFGTWPAFKASRKDPIAALQHH